MTNESLVDVDEGMVMRRMFDERKARTVASFLVEKGFDSPAPDRVSDEEMPAAVRRLASALRELGVSLEYTDHLDDRELYEFLWTECLPLEMELCPGDSRFWCVVGPLGGCSEEENLLFLRYYATEEERKRWAQEFADLPIPPHEEPPHRRPWLDPHQK